MGFVPSSWGVEWGVGDDQGEQKLLHWGQPESGLLPVWEIKQAQAPLPPAATHTEKERDQEGWPPSGYPKGLR